jgi:hypothetical protein
MSVAVWSVIIVSQTIVVVALSMWIRDIVRHRRNVRRIQQEYLNQLERQWDYEDAQLDDFCFDLEANSHRTIIHNTIQ